MGVLWRVQGILERRHHKSLKGAVGEQALACGLRAINLNAGSETDAIPARFAHFYIGFVNTTFVSWQAFQPNELRAIEIDHKALTLVYENESELELAFSDEEQLDRFVSHLVTSLAHRESPEEVRWN